MKMKLVGTNHFDLNGPWRTDYLLSVFKPRKITVEYPSNITPEEVENKVLNGAGEAVERISLLDVPKVIKSYLMDLAGSRLYEVMSPLKYAKVNRDVEVFFVDYPDVASIKLSIEAFESTIKSLPQEILDALNTISYNKFRKAQIEWADKSYYDEGWFSMPALNALESAKSSETGLEKLDDPEFEESREHYTAQKILEIMPDMHIAGVCHVSEQHLKLLSVKPLYARLQDAGLAFDKVLLCEAEKYS